MKLIQSATATLADLWRSSALIQGLLALLFGGAIVYLAVQEKTVPEILGAALMAIMGFYFGAKTRTTN